MTEVLIPDIYRAHWFGLTDDPRPRTQASYPGLYIEVERARLRLGLTIDNSSYRLIFYLDKKDEIYHYSSKEHPKISKIAKLFSVF